MSEDIETVARRMIDLHELARRKVSGARNYEDCCVAIGALREASDYAQEWAEDLAREYLKGQG